MKTDPLRSFTFEEWLQLKMPRLREEYKKEWPVRACLFCDQPFFRKYRQDHCSKSCSQRMRTRRLKEKRAEWERGMK